MLAGAKDGPRRDGRADLRLAGAKDGLTSAGQNHPGGFSEITSGAYPVGRGWCTLGIAMENPLPQSHC